MGSLRRHYNAIHSGLKYPCSECDHVSNTAANLKYHHNTVHMGLRQEYIIHIAHDREVGGCSAKFTQHIDSASLVKHHKFV